jgi:hypothetical protein
MAHEATRLRRRLALLSTVGVAVFGVHGTAVAQSDKNQAGQDPRDAKIERLEAEVQELAGEVRALKREQTQQKEVIATRLPAEPPGAQVSPAASAEAATEVATPAAEGGKRNFEVYGFAQADYIQDFNRVDPNWEATLRPSKIPTIPGLFGSNGQAVISVRQSRFGVQADQEIGGQDLYVKFEFDLFGVGVDEGQTTFRLRHAFGRWGPILAGQTDTLFMDGSTFPNTIDYWGPAGMVFVRNPQVRLFYKTGPHSFAIAIEKPGNDIDPGNIRIIDPDVASGINGDEKIPDFTAQYRYEDDWGHVQVAGVLRKVGFDTFNTPSNEPKGDELGWGVNVSTNIKPWNKDVLHASAVYGHGIASYMNDGGTDLGPSLVIPPGGVLPPSLRADTLPLRGLMFYYDHYWLDELSTSLGWSETRVWNTSFQQPEAFRSGEYASINLLWQPNAKVMMGAEYLWGRREDFDRNTGEDNRLQFSFKYAFSSNDFLH